MAKAAAKIFIDGDKFIESIVLNRGIEYWGGCDNA